ncbi:hypothetical protein AHAS_Ahas14G0148700 [Arachis hypogaea]
MIGRRGENSFPFDSEIERTFLRRRKEARGKGIAGEELVEENLETTMEEEAHNHVEEEAGNHAGQERRVLGSYINPNPGNCGSSILKLTIHANNFELKPQLITLVQNNCSYGGSAQEDPNQHLNTFLRICDTVKSNGVHPDIYKLLLFPFSLKDKAAKWLESFPKDSLTTWEEIVNRFLTRFYPPQRINRLRAEAVDHSSGGSLNKKKNIEEAIDVIETVAENEYFYASERTQKKRVLELNSVDALLAQNKAITTQIVALTKRMEANQASVIQDQTPQQEGNASESEGD